MGREMAFRSVQKVHQALRDQIDNFVIFPGEPGERQRAIWIFLDKEASDLTCLINQRVRGEFTKCLGKSFQKIELRLIQKGRIREFSEDYMRLLNSAKEAPDCVVIHMGAEYIKQAQFWDQKGVIDMIQWLLEQTAEDCQNLRRQLEEMGVPHLKSQTEVIWSNILHRKDVMGSPRGSEPTRELRRRVNAKVAKFVEENDNFAVVRHDCIVPSQATFCVGQLWTRAAAIKFWASIDSVVKQIDNPLLYEAEQLRLYDLGCLPWGDPRWDPYVQEDQEQNSVVSTEVGTQTPESLLEYYIFERREKARKERKKKGHARARHHSPSESESSESASSSSSSAHSD